MLPIFNKHLGSGVATSALGYVQFLFFVKIGIEYGQLSSIYSKNLTGK